MIRNQLPPGNFKLFGMRMSALSTEEKRLPLLTASLISATKLASCPMAAESDTTSYLPRLQRFGTSSDSTQTSETGDWRANRVQN